MPKKRDEEFFEDGEEYSDSKVSSDEDYDIEDSDYEEYDEELKKSKKFKGNPYF